MSTCTAQCAGCGKLFDETGRFITANATWYCEDCLWDLATGGQINELYKEIKRLRSILQKVKIRVDAFKALDALAWEEGAPHRPGWATVDAIDKIIEEAGGET